MELRHQYTKKDLWLVLWADVFLFGLMMAIFFLDQKANLLTKLVGKILS